MTRCKYYDCGFCYAPKDIKSNDVKGACIEPEYCPYLKSKMTEKEHIQNAIRELQEKLKKLEEQDPEMLLLRQGKVDFVDYCGKKYFRIEYTDSFAGEYSWYVRRIGEDAIRPVRDVNVYAPLEELYQKEVVKQKDDYPYKKYTPEETEQSLKEAFVKAQQTENWRTFR